MRAADLTDHEAHLVRHAAAMGGWLSAGYFTGEYAEAVPGLQARGVFVLDSDGRHARYVLTDEGQRLAGELGGAR